MPTFRAADDTGRVVEPLDPVSLRQLLEEAAVFVVVDDSDGDQVAEVRRADGERWWLEVRSGEPQQHLRARAPNTDATFDMLRSWCAGDGWWREAFGWERNPS